MIDFIIKKARLNDIPEIGALIISCWRNSYKNIIDKSYLNALNAEKRAKFISDALISGAFLCCCAWLKGKIVGVCLFRTASIRGLAGCGELSNLYVEESLTRNGIGGKLLNISIDYMRSIGLNYIILNVLKQNTNAVDFYKKRGFNIIAENQVMLGSRTYPFLLMRKRII